MALSLKNITAARVADALASRANYYFVHPVIGTIPRMLWGNDAGFRGNVRGELDRARGRRAYEATNGAPPPRDPDAAQLRTDGYLRIDPEYAPGALDRVRRSYAALIASDEGSRWNGVGKYRETARAIVDPARKLDGVAGLLTAKLRRIVESYYGGWFDVMLIQAWRTEFVPGLEHDTAVEAYSNQWHNDRFPTSWLRLFVYLSDGVTRETGAFRCHPIPSTKKIVRSGGYLRRSLILENARAQLEDEGRIVYFEGDAGAACFANAMHCLHRAGVPKPGTSRDMLAFTFRPATKPLRDGWEGDVLGDDERP